ncbi:MAG: hypothetical protein KGI50_00380 [Patescibacteria group bacterium]|nr:hypothetical protein [Patescibacteria group bacterium]MDE2438188.1 hypothetical protein [Patescibacteria group bacterium]
MSKEVLIKGEDEKALLELQKRLRQELNPASEIEYILVDRISSNVWRLKRALSFEKDDVFYIGDFDRKISLKVDADLFFRYETMLERSLYKALHELQRIQSARNGEKPPAPIAIDVDINNE